MGTKAYTARKIGLETNGDSFKELSAAKAGCAPLSSDKAIKIFKKGRFQVTAEFLHKLGGQSSFFALIPNLIFIFPQSHAFTSYNASNWSEKFIPVDWRKWISDSELAQKIPMFQITKCIKSPENVHLLVILICNFLTHFSYILHRDAQNFWVCVPQSILCFSSFGYGFGLWFRILSFGFWMVIFELILEISIFKISEIFQLFFLKFHWKSPKMAISD